MTCPICKQKNIGYCLECYTKHGDLYLKLAADAALDDAEGFAEALQRGIEEE